MDVLGTVMKMLPVSCIRAEDHIQAQVVIIADQRDQELNGVLSFGSRRVEVVVG